MKLSEIERMRNTTRRCKNVRKMIADFSYDKDLYESIFNDCKKIAQKFGLSDFTAKNFTSMVTNGMCVEEITNIVASVFNILERYGYSFEESKSIIESNNSLLYHSTLDLMHTLAITNKYGFDETILTRPTVYSRLTDKKMFALIKELEVNGVEPTLENVTKLYDTLSNKKFKSADKEDELIKLTMIHPLTSKDLFVSSMMYNQNMNKKTLTRTK